MNNNLRELRTHKKMSTLDLARELGVDEEVVLMWEDGVELSTEELHTLSTYFSVSTDYLKSFDIPVFDNLKKECVRRLLDSLSLKESKGLFEPKERSSIRASLNKGIIPRLEYLPLFEELVGSDWTCIAICELVEGQKSVIYKQVDYEILNYAQDRVPSWYKEMIKIRKKLSRKSCMERAMRLDVGKSEIIKELAYP